MIGPGFNRLAGLSDNERWVSVGARLSATGSHPKRCASFTVPGVAFPVTRSPAGVETIHAIVLNLIRRRLLVSDGARSGAFALPLHPQRASVA